jgi:Mrp family chromosome partitioning ATPase
VALAEVAVGLPVDEVADERLDVLARVRQRVTPVVLARERALPVLAALEPLLPHGLARGSTLSVEGGAGGTTLAVALASAASAAGSWTAVVGAPSLGLLTATEVGIAPERLLVVADPPRQSWSTVVAALVDAVDLVLVVAPRVAAAEARRLAARARERGAVVVVLPRGGAAWWPVGPDVRLRVGDSVWTGPAGGGAGRLEARRAEVVAGGRGAASRERRATLWLPGRDGAVTPV